MSTHKVADPVVSLENVEVHFENRGFMDNLLNRSVDTVKAVDDVSLDIPENDVVALVGESGCGKTTLGKTAVGLQRPTGGSVTYRGQDIWVAKDGTGAVDVRYEEIRRSLQVIHQDPGSSLNPNRTVMASMATPLKKWRPDMSPDERETMVYKLLERMGMQPASDYATRFPHQLSGGEQQRVALGRALMMEPDLILADEAVSALDVSLRVEMMDLMLDLQEMFNTSYLFISHDFSNARYLAEKADGRIGIMYLGKLVEIGPAQEVLQNPKHPYTKVLTWATPVLDPDEAAKAAQTEPPIRTIDIPDPENPPTGCNFHSRCPNVIPPDNLNISQEVYNKVMTVRSEIADKDLDRTYFWEEVAGEVPKKPGQTGQVDQFVDRALETLVDGGIPEPHGGRVRDALEAVALGNWQKADASLRDRYESVCETTVPALPEMSHPAACHLYEQPADLEVVETGLQE